MGQTPTGVGARFGAILEQVDRLSPRSPRIAGFVTGPWGRLEPMTRATVLIGAVLQSRRVACGSRAGEEAPV